MTATGEQRCVQCGAVLTIRLYRVAGTDTRGPFCHECFEAAFPTTTHATTCQCEECAAAPKATKPERCPECVRLREILRALLTNPHVDLGDLVYSIREREGKGWDGPALTAWNKAVMDAKAAIGAARVSDDPAHLDDLAANEHDEKEVKP